MKVMISAATALVLAVAPLAAQTAAPATTTASAATAAPVNFIQQQSQTEVLGTDFMGTTVYSKDGQKLGDINNLVFDQNGRLATAVIGVGGFLGISQKEVAVPFETLTSDMRDKKHVLVLDASQDQLKAAPAYKTLNDQAFNQQIADWRGKANVSWTQMKDRASKAYDDAKVTVKDTAIKAQEEANKQAPSVVPAPTTPVPATTPR